LSSNFQCRIQKMVFKERQRTVEMVVVSNVFFWVTSFNVGRNFRFLPLGRNFFLQVTFHIFHIFSEKEGIQKF